VRPIALPPLCWHAAKEQYRRVRQDGPVEGNWIMIVLGIDRLDHAP
jgi:hypothetical protein